MALREEETMKIGSLMTRSVKTCEARDRVVNAVRSMDEACCGALPVLENGRVVAMVTDRDICLELAKRNARPKDLTVREVMSEAPLHSIREDEDVDRALQLMRRWKVRRLPVIDRAGVLHGIISMNDIVRSTGETASASDPSYADTVSALRAICERQRRAPSGDWLSRPASPSRELVSSH
jgi:CBS domain-containing protein